MFHLQEIEMQMVSDCYFYIYNAYFSTVNS